MFTSFLFKKLSHHSEGYQNESEFISHLMSGEVKISIPDLINIHQEYEKSEGMVKFKYGQDQTVQFTTTVGKRNSGTCLATVTGRHVYGGNKHKYDLALQFDDGDTARIYNIPEKFILPAE
jgi:hypothetical protein